MNIGTYVRNYRQKHHMTMQEFADKTGLSKGYISMLENGKHPQTGKSIIPSIDTVNRIASALGITIDEIVDSTNPNQQVYIGDEPVYEASAGSGRIGDGSPSEEYAIRMKADECLVRVKGKSMQPTLMDDDLVVISAQSVLEYPRQMCLVKINGDESTIKRVEQKPNGLLLIGDNIDVYEPHFYTDDEVVNLPVTIEGVVVKIIRDVR